MSNLYRSSVAIALGCLGMALAQAQQTTPPPQLHTSTTEGTAADRTQPGETPTRSTTREEQQQDPRPSTSETEGTAADRTAAAPDRDQAMSQPMTWTNDKLAPMAPTPRSKDRV